MAEMAEATGEALVAQKERSVERRAWRKLRPPSEDEDMLEEDRSTQFFTMVQRGQYVITGIFSEIFLGIIDSYGAGFELNITVLLGFILWLMVQSQLDKYLRKISTYTQPPHGRRNRRWLRVLLRVNQFITYIVLFTVFRLFGRILQGFFTGAPWPSEAALGVVLVILALYSFIAVAESLRVYNLIE
jgi:hypothetical protein